MTAVENGTTPSRSFPPDTRVRITDLAGQRDDLSSLHIAAQVVLVWPYSSSTRKFSVLLSESDARPLTGRKQVKVTFLNGAARAAQQSKVGIGDGIRLQLEGFQWAQTDDAISTPGKRVDGDIQFRKHLAFEIVRSSGPPQQVQYQSTGTPSPAASPAVNGVLEVIRDLQTAPSKIAIPYSTPAVRKVSRLSSTSYFDSPLDPFAEDKEYVYGRSSKRTKFARPSGDWKLVDTEDEVKVPDVETPVKDPELNGIQQTEEAVVEPEQTVAQPEITAADGAVDVVDLISPIEDPPQVAPFPSEQRSPAPEPPASVQQAPTNVERADPASAMVMKPPETPVRPHRRERPTSIDLDDHAEDSDATTTPRLLPMESPGLPLVSPLIRRSGAETGYFPPAEQGVSELDAIGKPEDEATSKRQSSTASSTEASDSDASLVMLDEPPRTSEAPIPSSAIDPNAVEDEDMYGASQPPLPIDKPEEASQPRSRDALDVLEEFLQISPTVPEEPYHVENKGELNALGRLEATPERHLETASEPVIFEPAEPGPAPELPVSHVAVADQGLSGPAISEPESDEGATHSESSSSEDEDEVEIPKRQLLEPDSPRARPQSTNSEDAEEVEILQGQVEELVSSPALSQSASSADAAEAGIATALVEEPASSPVRPQSASSADAAEAGIATALVEEPASSPVRPQSASSADAAEARIATALMEEPASSPVRPQTASGEPPEEVRRPPSRTLSLDGTMDEDDNESLEQVPLSQHVAREPTFEDRPKTSELLSTFTSQNNEEIKPLFDEGAIALSDTQDQHPPTPTYTQDQPVAAEGGQVLAKGMSLLPTPDNTQEQEQPASSQVVPAPDTIVVDLEAAMQPSGDAAERQQPRRASHRLTRRSVASENISSPYFTPRKPHRALRSSPLREEPQPSRRDESVPPSSPPAGPPSSPTRPVTRSQRDTSKLPFVSVTGDQLGEVEALPSSPAEALQDTAPKNGTSTSSSYYPPLASLKEHFSQLVDIIALVVDESTKPERAKSGPKDHYTILHLVDPSVDSPSKVRTTAQIFRPARQALPTARRSDVVVLRNFRVQTAKHKWILLSTESSAWAVFSANVNTRSMFDEVTMSGPPVEYAAGERLHVKKLAQWWQAEGERVFPMFGRKPSVEIPRRNAESSAYAGDTNNTDNTTSILFEKEQGVVETVETISLSSRRTRRRNNMTDNFGNGEDPMTSSTEEPVSTTPTAVRHQPARRAKSKTPAMNGSMEPAAAASQASSPAKRGHTPTRRPASLVHELRDGTEYVDGRPAAEEGSSPPQREQVPTSRGPTPSKGGSAPAKRGPSLVHELRDGTKYVDDGREHEGGVVHELRDGRNYVDE